MIKIVTSHQLNAQADAKHNSTASPYPKPNTIVAPRMPSSRDLWEESYGEMRTEFQKITGYDAVQMRATPHGVMDAFLHVYEKITESDVLIPLDQLEGHPGDLSFSASIRFKYTISDEMSDFEIEMNLVLLAILHEQEHIAHELLTRAGNFGYDCFDINLSPDDERAFSYFPFFQACKQKMTRVAEKMSANLDSYVKTVQDADGKTCLNYAYSMENDYIIANIKDSLAESNVSASSSSN